MREREINNTRAPPRPLCQKNQKNYNVHDVYTGSTSSAADLFVFVLMIDCLSAPLSTDHQQQCMHNNHSFHNNNPLIKYMANIYFMNVSIEFWQQKWDVIMMMCFGNWVDRSKNWSVLFWEHKHNNKFLQLSAIKNSRIPEFHELFENREYCGTCRSKRLYINK
jgi:hypothetical protein